MGHNAINTEKIAGATGLPKFMGIIGNEHLSLYATEFHISARGIIPYHFGLGTYGDFFSLDLESVHGNTNDVH
jgi:hypothetical protein